MAVREGGRPHGFEEARRTRSIAGRRRAVAPRLPAIAAVAWLFFVASAHRPIFAHPVLLPSIAGCRPIPPLPGASTRQRRLPLLWQLPRPPPSQPRRHSHVREAAGARAPRCPPLPMRFPPSAARRGGRDGAGLGLPGLLLHFLLALLLLLLHAESFFLFLALLSLGLLARLGRRASPPPPRDAPLEGGQLASALLRFDTLRLLASLFSKPTCSAATPPPQPCATARGEHAFGEILDRRAHAREALLLGGRARASLAFAP